MHLVRASAVTLACASLWAATLVEPATAKADEVKYWKPTTYYSPLIDEFIRDADRIDYREPSSRKSVAARYHLTVVALDDLLIFLRDMREDTYNEKAKPALRKQALTLIEKSDRASIALMFAAAAIGEISDDKCSADDIKQMMAGSRNRDADLWAIASACTSSVAFAVALDGAGATRSVISYVAMNWTRGDPASELAALDVLLAPDFLQQVDEEHREIVQADIARFKLAKLLDLGLLSAAISLADSLDPSVRHLVFRLGKDEIRASVGGIAVKASPYNARIAADYAAALALAGRGGEARLLLDLVAPVAERRKARACLDAAKQKCGISDYDGIPADALIVDHFLDQPDADPYLLSESRAGDFSSTSAAITEVLCRLLTRPGEQEECRQGRKAVAEERAAEPREEVDSRELWAAIARSGGSRFQTARSAYAASLASLGVVKPPADDWSRAAVDPEPPAFVEHPLPTATERAREPLDPKKIARLPDGFGLVRMERAGQKIAAVSISQYFDPNGEVTGGGYWLHLSDDGGKKWKAPLYTGLAEHFPYVVAQESALPLLAGDKILLEVEEALLDTSSITYPPVGMRLKRKRQGIYLEIPIADLQRDSDQDGLSDIAARHLLLDKPSDTGTPFIVGRDRNCGASTPETVARVEMLKKLLNVEAQAIIPEIESDAAVFGPWRGSNPAEKPPIFLSGNPADYRCVSIDRPMIVYGEADRVRLRKFSPDFQLLQLPTIRWNRTGTRGFVNWSAGWAGGTYRILRDGRRWKFETISSWVT